MAPRDGRELGRNRSGQGLHPNTGHKIQQNQELITPIKVINTKLIKNPGSFQVRDSRASVEQPRRETRVETAEADKIEGDFKVSHPTNKNLITLIKVIITELIKDPGSFQVRDSRASVEQPRRETRVETAEADKIEGDFKVSHSQTKNLITLIKVITKLIKDPPFQVLDHQMNVVEPRRDVRDETEGDFKVRDPQTTDEARRENELEKAIKAKSRNKTNKGANDALPCVLLNVTNRVDYPNHLALLRIRRIATTKYTYEVRKAEVALLQKLKDLEMELNVASTKLDPVIAGSCQERITRDEKTRSNFANDVINDAHGRKLTSARAKKTKTYSSDARKRLQDEK